MFAVHEITCNPFIFMYHVSIELTRTVVEGICHRDKVHLFAAGGGDPGHSLCAGPAVLSL